MKTIQFFGILAVLLCGAGLALNSLAIRGDGAAIGEALATPDTNVQPTPAAPTPVPPVTDLQLRISGPYAHENLEVFLIHGKDQPRSRSKVLTLEEALEQGKAVVHETGDVHRLAVVNLSDDADIFIQSGDIVQGGRQDRVLAVDLLISPGKKAPIASFCVEQGRWGTRAARSDDKEAEATDSFRSSANCLPSTDLKRAVLVAADQALVWAMVARCQQSLVQQFGRAVLAAESASSLELTLCSQKVEQAAGGYVKALAKAIDGKDDVIGFALAVNGKVASADVYGSSELFCKLWRKLLHAGAIAAVISRDNDRATQPHCKSIRNDKGFWETLEDYVSRHSEAEFSHGICPSCLERHFPDQMDDPRQERE